MGFLEKLFKKNNDENKYNIKAEENQPRKVYGIPNPNSYNIDPKENQPRKVYGVPRPTNLNDSSNVENILKRKCYEIMQSDNYWGGLLFEYMNSLKFTHEKKMDFLNKLATDKQIVNEFSKYLVQKIYDFPNAIEVNGKTAKIIFEENPELTAIEVYLKLIDEKENN